MELTLKPASEAMRNAAEDFFRLLYVEHQFAKAMRAHVAPKFIEHNAETPNDPEDQIQWFIERGAARPDQFAPESEWKSRIVHKLIVANYLIVHYHNTVSASDRGRMFADFWKFDGDKIVEHWDVIQPVPEKTFSGNTMW
jgi:predicted SnoaL-like aldol condensation-catalyzing enzyme